MTLLTQMLTDMIQYKAKFKGGIPSLIYYEEDKWNVILVYNDITIYSFFDTEADAINYVAQMRYSLTPVWPFQT